MTQVAHGTEIDHIYVCPDIWGNSAILAVFLSCQIVNGIKYSQKI